MCIRDSQRDEQLCLALHGTVRQRLSHQHPVRDLLCDEREHHEMGIRDRARPEQLTLQNYADVSDVLFAFR